MGATLSIDERRRILLVRFEAVVTDEVLLEGYRRLRQWYAENGYCGNISDFSGVSSFEVTGVAIRGLASNTPLVPGNFVRIIVAPQDEVYGMCRMFEMMGSERGNRVDIVRKIEDAYGLAGIDGTEFRTIDGC
jgi:hypothetical protein